MKDVKRRLCTFSFYDQLAIEETLEDMAQKGWMLEKTGNLIWTYRRMEPKKLRFSITYFPDASDFDPGPTEGELTRIDYCLHDGWRMVARWGVMSVFCSENPDAVPIETEPVTQVENICQSVKKKIILPQTVLCMVLLMNLAMRVSMWKRDPAGELSDPLSLYGALMYGMLALVSLYEIGFYVWWSRKARAAAENDGVFLRIQSRWPVGWILLSISILLLLLAGSGFPILFGAVFCLLCGAFLIGAGMFIKVYLRKRGTPGNLNRVVSAGSVAFLTVLFMNLIAVFIISGSLHFSGSKPVVGTYELYGRTRNIYDDPLPLEIEELADGNARWSKESDHQETILLSSTEYHQYAVPADGHATADERELEYTITDVKWDFLYDFIKKALLNAHQDETDDGVVFVNHYEPVDAAIWNADDAYQLHWSSSVMNTYLVCWENRIVEIRFFWEPTLEQIKIAAEKLKE